MVHVMARALEAENVGVAIQVFPGGSLYKPREQWGALTKGQLDLAVFPLDYAAGRHPQFSVTLMPGLVRSHARALRMNDSEFLEDIKRIIEDAGVVVVADAWIAGAFASKKHCITNPGSMQGQVTRAAGPAFEQMLAAAGASISSMPSSEIYTGMQTGVLDAANTSTSSFVSFRLYELVVCITAPGENALWFMYEPILMSKKSWDGLSPEQQAAVLRAARAAEDYFNAATVEDDQKMIRAFRDAGVEVIEMSREDFDAWLAVAKDSAYRKFAEDVPGGRELIEKALAVE
jgi:TRAP-type C4-dicarboxylate transport system substrate-binding protein